MINESYFLSASRSFWLLIRSRTPKHFLQESCRSGTCQTLSARILQVFYNSDKPVRYCQMRHFLQSSHRSKYFLQDSWTIHARQYLKLERTSGRKSLECTENVKIVYFSILNQEYVRKRLNLQEPCAETVFLAITLQDVLRKTVISTKSETMIQNVSHLTSMKVFQFTIWLDVCELLIFHESFWAKLLLFSRYIAPSYQELNSEGQKVSSLFDGAREPW